MSTGKNCVATRNHRRRPTKIGLPIFLAALGTFRFDLTLDFGSFRDLQRTVTASADCP
jgi:hypothetical protein